MAKYKKTYRIESNRHRYWDYSNPGEYFITICTHDRDCFLGHVIDGNMKLSTMGQIVQDEMFRIPGYHHQVHLPASVVMPNHVHMIVSVGSVGSDGSVVEKIHEFSLRSGNNDNETINNNHPYEKTIPWWHNDNYEPTIDEIKQYRKQRRKMIIPKIVGKFKMITSKQINIIRNTPDQKNWQANYHDHIIRNDQSYDRIRHYIINNPLNWGKDKFHG